MKLDLIAIAPPDFDVDVTLAYATDANLTGRPVYRNAECWLHRKAAERLAAAVALARPLGLRLRIFDALRPVEAQWALWNVNPDPEFLADPRRGSPHSRGVAVDLSLLDDSGRELDMGTAGDFRNNPSIPLMKFHAGGNLCCHNFSAILDKSQSRFIAGGFNSEDKHEVRIPLSQMMSKQLRASG